MSEKLGKYFTVPNTIQAVGGITLEKGMHLWIPGTITDATHPQQFYALPHAWHDEEPGVEMVKITPNAAGWLELLRLIEQRHLIPTSQFGLRL